MVAPQPSHPLLRNSGAFTELVSQQRNAGDGVDELVSAVLPVIVGAAAVAAMLLGVVHSHGRATSHVLSAIPVSSAHSVPTLR